VADRPVRGGDPVDGRDVVVRGEPPLLLALFSRSTASGSDSVNPRPVFPGARCGISIARALAGFAAMMPVISLSSANSS